jgi:hypothetical protein
MKQKYWLCKRKNTFFSFDSETGKRESLLTDDKAKAQRILRARNDAALQPAINISLAKAYLLGTDPKLVEWTWAFVIQEYCAVKKASTGCGGNAPSKARHSISSARNGWCRSRRRIFMRC